MTQKIVEGVDIGSFDKNKPLYNREQIYQILEQRYEFKQLDAILALDLEENYAVGYRRLVEDEFWVKGHIPGSPLYPGVLMIEGMCQLTQFLFYQKYGRDPAKFLAFGGIDNARFRQMLFPGDEVIMLAKGKRYIANIAKSTNYIFKNGKLVVSGDFTGVLVPISEIKPR